MIYLLLYKDATEKEIKWLYNNALPVSTAAWIHNAEVPGTTAVVANPTVCKGLKDQIDYSCYKSITEIENKIKKNSLRGTSKRLAINKLNVIVSASSDMDVIGYAKDLLAILGEMEEDTVVTRQKPLIEKENQMGVDKKAVEDYLLRLAKEPSIH